MGPRMEAPPTYGSGDSPTASYAADKNEYGLENTSSAAAPEKFRKLGWKRLTICLIVEAIALGSLSIPSAFAAVGMVAGVILSVSIGLIAIYTSHVVGQVKLKYPAVNHYSDAVRLIWGKFGYELSSAMFVLLLVLLVGSHTLTGTIAFIRIAETPGMCALAWGVISAILLFLLAIPPTFAEFAWLGYIDFVSIIAAIFITIVATGVEGAKQPGGLSSIPWSAWPPEDVSFSSAFLAVTNIVFAYSFAVCQFSFMSELHTPTDYVKSIWALGLIEIFIYTLTGGLIYAFVGPDVASPALLSAGSIISRIAFGVALPVIFISGSINSTVVNRFIIDRAFARSQIRYTHDFKGWMVWLGLLVVITVIAFVIAEAIPFFSALLGVISSLFISGFTFYFPALFWFQLIKQGKWYEGRKNIALSVLNGLVLVIGVVVLVCGTYASVTDIVDQYNGGKVRSPFTCSSEAYA
ncbi:N amino acid transport system protein [Elsinoe fawcettii]|nr:N amino acid transport system protein [Elsinoe fawcettii]